MGVFPTVTYEPQGSGAGRRVMGERTGTERRRQPEPQPGTALRHDRRAADADGRQPDEPGNRRGRRRGHDPHDPGSGRLGRARGQLPGQLRPLAAAGLGRDEPGGGQRGAVQRPRAVHAHAGRGDLERRLRPRPVGRDLPDPRRRRGLQRRSSPASCGSTTRARRSRSRPGSTAVNPVRNWDPGFTTGPDTRNWPNASLVPRADCAGTPTGPQGTHLTSGCANGNGPLLAKLNATDGGVGYSDIATGRANGFDITPTASAGSRDDDRFWTQTTNPSNQFVEPTHDPSALPDHGRARRELREHHVHRRPGLDAGRLAEHARRRLDDRLGDLHAHVRARVRRLQGPVQPAGSRRRGRGAEGPLREGLLGGGRERRRARSPCSRTTTPSCRRTS